ncbi:MAG: permease [Kofleriaceae bacterium]
MPDTKNHSVVAIYDSHTAAEEAVKALQKAGLDMTRLSIMGKGFHTEEHAIGFYTSGDRMKFWGGRGAMWGALWGSLFGSAFFLLPVVGPLVVMGPLAGWIASAIEGAALGGAAGVLAAALTSVGIPKDSIVKYELEVKAGKFLVLANGSADMIEHARGILKSTGASELAAHLA